MLSTTKIFACIADPISHVKAPSLFTSIFKTKSINAVMIPLHVLPENLEDTLKAIKLIKNFQGFTVTIPHKTNIVKYCDYLEKDAELTQAVNWIKLDQDRKLIGNNFDGKGFVDGFANYKYSFKNKNISLFGAGGAAVAIACSVAKEGVKVLKIINRNIDKAYDLKKKISQVNSNVKVFVFSDDDYYIKDSDVVINATSLGLKKNDKLPFDIKKSSQNAIISDIIMDPEETHLLKVAKLHGRSIHYGKNMIKSQINLVGRFLNLW